MELVVPLLVFGAFLTLFAVQARREGKSTPEWLRARNRESVHTPGWWKPAAVLIAVLVAIFIGYVTIDQGFKVEYLLVIPIFAAFFAIAAALSSWFFKRQFKDH
jgi:hypothetical protein